MPATRVRLHAVSGTIIVSAEDRADVGVDTNAVREVGDDGTIEVQGKRKSSALRVSVPLGSDVTAGTVSGGIELIGVLGSVRVTSTSGSIDVECVENADLRTTSGHVVVERCTGLCRVSNKSGGVVVNDAGEGAISSVSGNVQIDVKSRVEVRTVSGKVEVQSGAGGPVSVQTVSGPVEVALPPGVKPNVRLRGRGKARHDYEPGDDVQVEVRTVSGKIRDRCPLMTPAAERSATATSAAEEIWGAIVFTDIVGFTEFTALEGDEQALALLQTQEDLVNDVLPAEARVVKELGDGLLLWFPDAASAFDTTLRLQSSFEDASTTGLPLWVRMGVHCGKALVRGADLIGHDVNVAARILDVAGPGEVLASEQARVDVEGRLPGVVFDELGPVVMKGIPTPVRLWRATRL